MICFRMYNYFRFIYSSAAPHFSFPSQFQLVLLFLSFPFNHRCHFSSTIFSSFICLSMVLFLLFYSSALLSLSCQLRACEKRSWSVVAVVNSGGRPYQGGQGQVNWMTP